METFYENDDAVSLDTVESEMSTETENQEVEYLFSENEIVNYDKSLALVTIACVSLGLVAVCISLTTMKKNKQRAN